MQLHLRFVHHALQRDVFTQGAQPVFHRLFVALGPFNPDFPFEISSTGEVLLEVDRQLEEFQGQSQPFHATIAGSMAR
jgi:hypothetical protein